MKKSIFHIKIPTFFGLFLTLAMLVLITMAFPATHPIKGQVLSLTTENTKEVPPQNIQITNIRSDKVTITWQTESPVIGQVLLKNRLFSDNRDKNIPKPYLTHSVTLDNLEPNTQYQFKITNNGLSYPQNNPFKTKGSPQISTLSSIFGRVLNPNLTPANDALVYLKTADNELISTHLTGDGNFLLPLTTLKKDPKGIEAILIITSATLSSEIELDLPFKNPPLPPIILGQNYNFKISAKTRDLNIKPQNNFEIFDLNKDGKINSIDLGVLLKNVNNPRDQTYDLNQDGLVDQKDINLLKDKI